MTVAYAVAGILTFLEAVRAVREEREAARARRVTTRGDRS